MSTAKDLKKTLKKLKTENGDIVEIKFVANKLRSILKSNSVNNNQELPEIDHDNAIDRNFWGYVKRMSKKRTKPYQHFINFTACLTSLNHF